MKDTEPAAPSRNRHAAGAAASDPGRYFGSRIPFLDLIGLQADELKPDHASAQLRFDESLTNSSGHLHGGSLMAALDFAMSAAARSSEPDRLRASTIDMRTSFVQAAAGDVRVVARCIHRGRSIAFCEATATGRDGGLLATTAGVFKLHRKDAAGDAEPRDAEPRDPGARNAEARNGDARDREAS